MKKSITKNYLYNLIYQILIIIVPLFTTPYLSRVLGAENIGIYSYTLSIATYFLEHLELHYMDKGKLHIFKIMNMKEVKHL